MARKGKTSATAARVDDESGDTDILLTVIDETSSRKIPLSWEGAHAARDALAQLTHEHAGKSIVQRLEADLDGIMDELMSDEANPEETPEFKGWARGLATAISYMRQSDMDVVREQAMERYEERTAS